MSAPTDSFDAGDGLTFQRLADGGVRIVKSKGKGARAKPALDQEISAATWEDYLCWWYGNCTGTGTGTGT